MSLTSTASTISCDIYEYYLIGIDFTLRFMDKYPTHISGMCFLKNRRKCLIIDSSELI
jgi:hypothetical protein